MFDKGFQACFAGKLRQLIASTILSALLLPAATFKVAAKQEPRTPGLTRQVLYFTGLDRGDEWTSTLSLVNPHDKRVRLIVRAFDRFGKDLGQVAGVDNLGALETIIINNDSLPAKSHSLIVEAADELRGKVTLKTIEGKKSEAIPGIRAGARALNFPVFSNTITGEAGELTVTLLNPSNTEFAVAEAIAFDEAGREIDRSSMTPLAKMESRIVSLRELFGGATLRQTAMVRINSTNDLIGFELVDQPKGDIAGLPALTSANTALRFPIRTSGGKLALWTSVHLFNPNDFAVQLEVEGFDSNSESFTEVIHRSVAPRSSFHLRPKILGALPSDPYSIRVTSDFPVYGYEVIGVSNGIGLTAMTGIPDEDQSSTSLELSGSRNGNTLNVNPNVQSEPSPGSPALPNGMEQNSLAEGHEEWVEKTLTNKMEAYRLGRAATIPAGPTNLTATVLNNSSIALYWHDKSTNESGFKIERKQGSGNWQQIGTSGANGSSFTGNYYADTSVSGSNYYYRIRSYNSSGNSEYSNEASSTTVQISTGFDFPVGNTEGTGAYTRNDNGQACTSTNNGNNWYVFADVTAPGYENHTGEDWNGACGADTDRNQPVYAASLGRVVYAGYVPGDWGNVVVVAHKLPTGEVIYTQYAHLERIDVTAGATVNRRQQVGTIGKGAGNQYAAHLHFEIRRVTVGAGNWPGNIQTIRNQYFDPSDRSSDTWTEPGFIEGHRTLSGGTGSACTDTGEPNGSFSQAYSISCNATTQAKICTATDVDYYRFTPNGTGNSTITLTPPSDKDYDLYIYNSSQQQIGASAAGTGVNERSTISVNSGQTYYVKVIGYNGAFSTNSSYGIGVSCPTGETTPAVNSFAINNGDSSTVNPNVTLNNSASGGPTQYQASESSSFAGASWQNYSTAPSFSLSSATGTKTVYFRVKNASGTVSATVSDTITLTAPAISWDFNTAGDFQGWSCINIQAASVNSGFLFVDFRGADPYMVGPGISANASLYQYVQLRMASNALDSAGRIYFKTASENFYSEDKSVSFYVYNCSLCGNASFYTYSISMGSNSKWSGIVTAIRVDPANNASSVIATDTVGVDYIRLSPTP